MMFNELLLHVISFENQFDVLIMNEIKKKTDKRVLLTTHNEVNIWL